MSNASNNGWAAFFAGIVIASFIWIIISMYAMYFVVVEMNSKAVELGAARWEVNQKTGDTTFMWNEEQESIQ